MRRTITLIWLVFALIFPIEGFGQDFEWVISSDGKKDDIGVAIDIDKNGNSFVCGNFQSDTLRIGNELFTNRGMQDVFLLKVDQDGQTVWHTIIGGSQDDIVGGIDVDSSGYSYVAITQKSDVLFAGGQDYFMFGFGNIFIAKFSPGGGLVWGKSIGGLAEDGGLGITTDKNGNVFVGGKMGSNELTIEGQTLNSIGASNLIVLKFDGSGNFQWAQNSNMSNPQGIIGNELHLSTDALGNVAVGGSYLYADLNWGETQIENKGLWDGFVLKLKSNGKLAWFSGFGGTEYEDVTGLESLGSYGVLISGNLMSPLVDFGGYSMEMNTSESFRDFFLMEYDWEGQAINGTSYGDVTTASCNGLSLDGFNNIYTCGYALDTGLVCDTIHFTDRQTFICKFAPSRGGIWGNQITSSIDVSAQDITSGKTGKTYVTGFLRGADTYFDQIKVEKVNPSTGVFITKINNPFYINTDENSLSKINIYPNPVSNILKWEAPVTSVTQIRLIDINGGLIMTKSVPKGAHKGSLNIKNLPDGVYFLYLNHPSSMSIRKIVKLGL